MGTKVRGLGGGGIQHWHERHYNAGQANSQAGSGRRSDEGTDGKTDEQSG